MCAAFSSHSHIPTFTICTTNPSKAQMEKEKAVLKNSPNVHLKSSHGEWTAASSRSSTITSHDSKSIPLIVTVKCSPDTKFENGHIAKYGATGVVVPHCFLADKHYKWLPRYFLADIIGTSTEKSFAYLSGTCDVPITIRESVCVLNEELESSFFRVANMLRLLKQSSSMLSMGVKNQLQNATSVDCRATSCLLSIWRLLLNLRSVQREVYHAL